jgi:rhamnose transport system permease protein
MGAGVVTPTASSTSSVIQPRQASRALIGRFDGVRGVLPAACVIVIALVLGARSSTHFLDAGALLLHTGRYVEIGLLALALTIVIINGDIDLSVASNVAVSAAVLAIAHRGGAPIAVACGLAVLTGLVLGLVNGVLVAVIGLPSLVATLGTLAAYRGISEILLGSDYIGDFPASFAEADRVMLFGTSAERPIPLPLVVLLLAAAMFGFLLQRTNFGLRCLLTGSNSAATRFSGISTWRVRLQAFALSGMMAGAAAVLIASRLSSVSAGIATGMELPAITVVVLGGTSIFGGRGSILGTVVALFAVMAVREALAINNVQGETQDAVIGLILIASILVPRTVTRLRSRLVRRRVHT